MFRLLFALPIFVRMLALDPAPDPKPDPPDPKPDPKPDPPKDTDPKPKPDDKGFPADTPVAEMTAEQQAAYWRHHARKHEQRAKDREDYDRIKSELDEIKAAGMSEQEKAVDEAKKAAKAEALREVGGRMVDAHIKASVTAGRLTQDQADVILDGLDRTRFLTTEGDVDTDKVTALLDKIAPDTGNGFPDLGQGRRPGGSKVSGKEQGREEARRRFGDRAAAK